jgi:coenzyme F420-dependent glucose-6-phosphate dehydrogenase
VSVRENALAGMSLARRPDGRGGDGEEVAMVRIGYKLSSEEQRPGDLVALARLAEQAGFGFALISDHYHPWIDRQGQSPFVWTVIGAIAHTTEKLELGTAVTCPTVRMHPAIVAQAAATAAAIMPGRFFLGVGTGEALNEHILGDPWPPTHIRQEMLEEAVAIIRLLWEGGLKNHRGRYYRVDNARIYSLPDTPPAIHVAVGGSRSAEAAGKIGDGMIATAAKAELVKAFEKAGGKGKPRYAELTVCWAKSETEARRTARAYWPIAAMPSALSWELPLPSQFEAAAELVTEEATAEEIACGPDPERHLEAITRYARAGFEHVCVHQVGPQQEGFMEFYAREVLPKFASLPAAA